MKKILFILDTIDIGGATKLTFDVINNIDKNIFDIEIIYLNDPKFAGENLLQFYGFEKKSKLLWYKNFRMLKRSLYLFKNLRKYDLVHSCMEQSNFYTTLTKNLPFSGFKLILTYHGLDSVYNIDDSLIKLKQTVSYRIVMKNLQNILLKNVNSIISVCTDLKEYLIINRGLDQGKVNVIYHGIDLKNFDKNKKSEIDQDLLPDSNSYTIGYIGRLGFSKGLEGLMNSVKEIKDKIPNLKLIIKGDGELKNFIENKISSEKFEDFVSLEMFEKNVCDFYKKIDLLVLPSFYETTNLTILESMYSGTIVLASKTGGIPEILRDGENGFMFKRGDFKDFINKIVYINKLSKNELSDIRKSAYGTVVNKFNLNLNILNIQDKFLEVINSI